jgi:hypothetical protein
MECMATRNLRTPSILLVSKSVDDSQVYTSALRAWGYRVVNAETRAVVCRASCHQSTNLLVIQATTLIANMSERVRNVAESWSIGTSRQSCRR